MNNINFIYIFPLIAVLLVAIYTLTSGKNTTKNSKTKYLILFLVCSILSAVLLVSFFYESEFKKNALEVDKILNTVFETKLNVQNTSADSLEIVINRHLHILDSLKKQNSELDRLLAEIKNQEKIIGKKIEVKNQINDKIKNNQSEIGEIESFNEILEKEILSQRKGYTTSGQSSNFIFECPEDFESEYLELKLKFLDEKLIAEIDYIFISVTEHIKDNRYSLLFEQVYSPQVGVNGFRIKNYYKLKDKKINLDIGYVLNSEKNKDYPRVEKITCKNY